VTTLKAKTMLLLFALATMIALPIELRADGNPPPTCPNGVCAPH